ncbi:hypothetical protein D3C80_1235230 [compost metagenome]
MKKRSFIERILEWVDYRDNYNVKVIGKDEELSETDTSLADLDEVIMTQYQLVSAIAKTPATKLLGTSPKGFNATGDNETKSYHETLETVQSMWYDRVLERHYLLLSKAYCDGVILVHTWEPVDSVSAEAEATIQKTRAETAAIYITNGVISPDEDRSRLRLDKDSGYSLPEDDDAPGVPVPGTEGGQPDAAPLTAAPVTQDEAEDTNVLGVVALVTAASMAAAQLADRARNKCSPALLSLVSQLAGALSAPDPKSVVATVHGKNGVEGSVKPSVGEVPTPPDHLKKPE